MDELPSYWTFLPGVIVGCIFIGRIARWLQFVRAIMGKGDASFAPEQKPRTWKTMLAVLAYPTLWIALLFCTVAVYHAVTSPFTNEWRWFYAGFFGGPLLLLALVLFRAKKIRRKRQGQPAPLK
jgi:hypothetical protein